jgi:hypothetical protein
MCVGGEVSYPWFLCESNCGKRKAPTRSVGAGVAFTFAESLGSESCFLQNRGRVITDGGDRGNERAAVREPRQTERGLAGRLSTESASVASALGSR